MFDFKFYTISDWFPTEVDAVLCADLIKSWTDVTEDERQMFLRELPLEGASLCPNTTEFTVMGGMWGSESLKLGIYDTDKSRELGLLGFVY